MIKKLLILPQKDRFWEMFFVFPGAYLLWRFVHSFIACFYPNLLAFDHRVEQSTKWSRQLGCSQRRWAIGKKYVDCSNGPCAKWTLGTEVTCKLRFGVFKLIACYLDLKSVIRKSCCVLVLMPMPTKKIRERRNCCWPMDVVNCGRSVTSRQPDVSIFNCS